MIFLLAIILLFSVEANAATPTVTYVAGTVTNGQTLTISGANMINENNTLWDSKFQSISAMYGFESAVSSGTALQTWPETDGYHLGPNSAPAGEPDGSIAMDCKFESTVKLAGNMAMNCRVRGGTNPGENNDGGSAVQVYPGSTSGNFYFRYYTRYRTNNGNYPDNYTKMTVTQPAGSGAMWYLDLEGAMPGQLPSALTTKYGSISGPSPSLNLQNNRWYCIEGIWLSPGTYQLYVDGIRLVNVSPGVAMPDNAYPQFGIINFASTSVVADINQWLDNLAFGHTGRIYPSSTIEISGDGGLTWKWQPPTSLSETSITVTAELPTLSVGAYRLRVKNYLQEVSAVYTMSGGSGDTVSPVVVISGDDPLNFTTTPQFLSGTAQDATGVVGCKARINAQPDATSGVALTGTTAWSGFVNSFPSDGSTVYVGCYDAAQNWGYDSIVANYTLTSEPGETYFIESFDNNQFADRDWYDNTNHGTIVSGGYSGNCLQWTWTQGEAQPVNGGSMRHLFPETDSLYVSFYVKFQTGWRGSQQTYHPHMITIPSNIDVDYTPLANNFLNTYIEYNTDLRAPYTTYPVIAIQDQQRVNTTSGSLPLDLSATTENRSVTYCNQPAPAGATGICYPDNPYYSANSWRSNIPILTNDWRRVEVYLKMNTIDDGVGQRDGVMREWIDGELVLNHLDVQYRTGQDATKMWSQFVLSPWIGDGAPITETMWLDEIEVGTEEPYITPEPGPEPWRTSIPNSFSGSMQ